MANACIAYTNLVDAASTITATSANLLLPVSNVTNPHVARKWQGTTPTGLDAVIIDMGAPVTFDTIAALGLVAQTIVFSASLVDPSGVAGEVYASSFTVDQSYKSQVAVCGSQLSARYFRFDVTAGTAGTFAAIGRLFIGVRTQFAYNIVKGWQRRWNDTSLRSKTRGGQTQIFPDVVYRSYDVSFDFITQSDRDGFVETIDRVNAMKTDVLFITDPASSNLSRDSVWGLMSALTPVVQPYIGQFTKQYQIDERL